MRGVFDGWCRFGRRVRLRSRQFLLLRFELLRQAIDLGLDFGGAARPGGMSERGREQSQRDGGGGLRESTRRARPGKCLHCRFTSS